MEIVIVSVGDQRYGLLLETVQEIVRAVTIAPLPKAPAIVEGVINLHGRVVPVLDLRSRFGLPAKPPDVTDYLVIAQANERLVAIRVDRLPELAQVKEEGLESLEPLVSGSEHVAGVAKHPDGLVLVHDLGGFLTQAESIHLSAALAAPPEECEGVGS
jgi:purine-binding chemotaxis protein CheW